jgi:hypothetical protein
LLWPAASIPTINHVVIDDMVNIAVVGEHVVKLVCQRDLREYVLEEVAKWVLLPEIFVLVKLLHVVISEAVAVKC